MSFRDLEGNKGNARHQPKQRKADEDSPYEKSIRAGVQELQETVRKILSQVEQAHRGRLMRRQLDSLETAQQRAEEISESIASQFRDWTVHLAGEPAERHRKKLPFDKLRKAFEEEVAHLKNASRRVTQAKSETANAASGGTQQDTSDYQESLDGCFETTTNEPENLLDDSAMHLTQIQEEDSSIRLRASVAQEREEGIKRIQNSVSEVNQMYRDLASIVKEQGQHFESLERQAESAATNTRQAVQELKKALDRQKGTRERLCCTLFVAVFLLCFVILPHLHSIRAPVEMHTGPALALSDAPLAVSASSSSSSSSSALASAAAGSTDASSAYPVGPGHGTRREAALSAATPQTLRGSQPTPLS
mmetsp:Transcript_98240/g.204894  ORF Transcript_98240/g.204894 Transcript_98240/m.204894 type:complete len:363 (-) Transcript_98240:31-1119(-)